MQPFGWPCGRLWEEGRRQVDIWPVCYCEFQILWLSLTLNLLEFFNLGIPETVPSQRLTSFLTRSPFPDPPPSPDQPGVAHILHQDSLFGGGWYLTHPRAGVRFRFNVSLLWEEAAGGAGVSLQGCGVSWSSLWQPSIPHKQTPWCHTPLLAIWMMRSSFSFFFSLFLMHSLNHSSCRWWRILNNISCTRWW